MRGGKRAGAGRPKGSRNQRSREIADRALTEGISPLEVMLASMRTHFEAGRWDDAAAIAKDAAPYIHPRLQAVEHAGDKDHPIVHTFRWQDEQP